MWLDLEFRTEMYVNNALVNIDVYLSLSYSDCISAGNGAGSCSRPFLKDFILFCFVEPTLFFHLFLLF